MNALILQVVDRVNGLNVVVIAVLLEVAVEQHGHHAGLPIVAVQNVRLEVHEVAHEVQYRALIEAVTLDIKNVINIDLVKVEVVLVVNKIEYDAVQFHREESRVE